MILFKYLNITLVLGVCVLCDVCLVEVPCGNKDNNYVVVIGLGHLTQNIQNIVY